MKPGHDGSPPLYSYVTVEQITARLPVLYAKADRIVAYNETLDPAVLDEKQQKIMGRNGCELGVDVFPPHIGPQGSLGYAIDFLQSRLSKFVERVAA